MSALPLLLAATIPLRNPFWPVGYHGSHEAISDAPRSRKTSRKEISAI